MKKKSQKKSIFTNENLAIFIGIVVMITLIWVGYKFMVTPVKTQTANTQTIRTSIDTEVFVIREEVPIEENPVSQATVLSLVTDGDRVASGDGVAMVFDGSDDAQKYVKAQQLRSELELFESMKATSKKAGTDIKKLNNSIDEIYKNMLLCSNRGDTGELESIISKYRQSLTSKQLIIGGDFDIEQKISSLETELKEFTAGGNGTEITANKSGYYVSHLDGFENYFDYNDVKNITVSQLNGALTSKATNVSSNTLGKIVTSYKWYLACVLDERYKSDIKIGQMYKVSLPEYGLDAVQVQTHSISSESGKIIVVFSCGEMNEILANIRCESAKLILKEYTGFKIMNEHIQLRDGEKGVYVLLGNLVKFRNINIVYEGEGFVLCRAKSTEEMAADEEQKPSDEIEALKAKNRNHVSEYDEIIVKGKELYDGKSVY